MRAVLSRPSWQLSLCSGVLVGFAYQPWYLGFLAYVGFIPIFHVFINHSARENLRQGYLFGITLNLVSFYWIGFNSGASVGVVLLSLIAAVLYLSIFWAIAGWVMGRLKECTNLYILFPFVIVSMEWFRSFGPMGFPWGNLALTQTDYLSILQIIELAGSYIIALWIISINVILYMLIQNKLPKRTFGILILMFLGLMVMGSSRMKAYENFDPVFDIAVLQPNIDPNEKWDHSKKEETIAIMDSLHAEAQNLNPDLIVFPETALPAYLRLNTKIRNVIQSRVDSSGIPVLSGTVDRRIGLDGEKEYFNSTMLLLPEYKYRMYEKIHLVPFAEYIPFSNRFPLLKKFNFGQGNFSHGNEFVVYEWDSIRFSSLICYESSIPGICRRFVQKGADILMILTNDGWLGNTTGPYQHYQVAILRAIENRVPVVRSANTGISGVILANGRTVHKESLGERAVFKSSISRGNTGSVYSRFGDVFSLVCFVIFVYLGPISCLRKKY